MLYMNMYGWIHIQHKKKANKIFITTLLRQRQKNGKFQRTLLKKMGKTLCQNSKMPANKIK